MGYRAPCPLISSSFFSCIHVIVIVFISSISIAIVIISGNIIIIIIILNFTRHRPPRFWDFPCVSWLPGEELRAAWTCGLGCTPLGYTTYAPNSMESAHKALKQLLPGNWKTRDSAGAVIEVSKVVASRLQSGYYAGPWAVLTHSI